MTKEEKKKADETAAAEAEAKKAEEEADDSDEAEVDEEEESSEDEEEESEHDDKSIDYKAIADEERKKREDSDRANADLAYKNRKLKRKLKDEDIDEDEDEDIEDDDKPLSRREINKVISDTAQKTERRLMSGQIRDMALRLSGSDDEAEAIIATHANRSWPSDIPLSQQLEESQAIVNRKSLASKNSELKRALRSKGTVSRGENGTIREGNKGSQPKVEKTLELSLKRTGFELDTKTKIWKKKLPSGLYLYKDARGKTVKTWTGK